MIDKIIKKDKQAKNKAKIRYLDNSLLINNEILVFSDFHIGYEEYLYGKMLPVRIQLDETLSKLNGIFQLLDKDKIKIKEIVILGDLKHEFGEISDSEWRETLELLDYFSEKCKKIVLIRGNHDNILGPIARKREIETRDYYVNGEICFLHGNELFDECKDCGIFILGHLHPSITLSDSYKKEKFKCFLHGMWKKKEIYIIPSFVPLVFGYDLREGELDKDKKDFFIIGNRSLERFEVIVYNEKEDGAYNFGKLGKIAKN